MHWSQKNARIAISFIWIRFKILINVCLQQSLFKILMCMIFIKEQEELSLTRVVRDAKRRKNGGKAKHGNRKGNRSPKKKQRMMKKVKKAGKRMRMQRKKSAGATKVRSSARQNGKYTGPPCSYIIFENILTNGAGCKTGQLNSLQPVLCFRTVFQFMSWTLEKVGNYEKGCKLLIICFLKINTCLFGIEST